MQNLRQVEKWTAGQKMLLSSSLDLVKYINPNLFYYYFAKTHCTVLQLSSQKRPAYKCKFCFTRHEREEHQGRGLELHFFFCREFPAHQKYTAKGQKDRDAKKIAAFSPSQSYKQLHNNIRLEKPLSRLWKHGSQHRQKGQATCKREKEARCTICDGLSIITIRFQRE